MRCREVVDALGAYLDGELSDPLRARIDGHLTGCPDCRTYLATYRRTVGLAGDAFRDPDAPPMPDDLVDAVLGARRRR